MQRNRTLGAMRITPFGIAGQLGACGIRQLILHLSNFLKLFSRLFKDPRVSLAPKLVPLGVLNYLILPVDLLPTLSWVSDSSTIS